VRYKILRVSTHPIIFLRVIHVVSCPPACLPYELQRLINVWKCLPVEVQIAHVSLPMIVEHEVAVVNVAAAVASVTAAAAAATRVLAHDALDVLCQLDVGELPACRNRNLKY
jgi:hypothetical protein